MYIVTHAFHGYWAGDRWSTKRKNAITFTSYSAALSVTYIHGGSVENL